MTNRNAMSEITVSEVREWLFYEPETGLLRWKKRPAKGRVLPGDIAGGWAKGGYRVVKISQKRFAAHRLVWFYVHGEWPQDDIDHINGIRTDNRIANLRDVTRSVNLQNLRAAKAHNQLGILGVRKRGNRYGARINVNGQDKHIGYFDTAEEAGQAYLAAKRQLHEGCAI